MGSTGGCTVVMGPMASQRPSKSTWVLSRVTRIQSRCNQQQTCNRRDRHRRWTSWSLSSRRSSRSRIRLNSSRRYVFTGWRSSAGRATPANTSTCTRRTRSPSASSSRRTGTAISRTRSASIDTQRNQSQEHLKNKRCARTTNVVSANLAKTTVSSGMVGLTSPSRRYASISCLGSALRDPTVNYSMSRVRSLRKICLSNQLRTFRWKRIGWTGSCTQWSAASSTSTTKEVPCLSISMVCTTMGAICVSRSIRRSSAIGVARWATNQPTVKRRKSQMTSWMSSKRRTLRMA